MSSFNNMSNTLRSIIVGLALICLVIGYLIGGSRVGFNAGPKHLSPNYLDLYVVGLASNFAQTGDTTLVKHGLCFNDTLAAVQDRFDTFDAAASNNPGTVAAYQQVIPIVRSDTDQICTDHRAIYEGEEAGLFAGLSLSSLLTNLLGVLLIALLIGAIAWYFLTRRGAIDGGSSEPPRNRYVEPVVEGEPIDDRSWDRILRREQSDEKTKVAAPAKDEFRRAATATAAVDPSQPQPIGGFSTTYNRGDDAFDKSFIIENSNGDFLGECGVSISEYVNTDDGARNVTAFEIWLFDKNDTHTVTKVLMSEHAFGDEATRAKLAVRGESVLASLNETVALETNALIINANVNDLAYAATSPSRGIFERFTIDLSAWVKSQMEQGSSSASDMLNF